MRSRPLLLLALPLVVATGLAGAGPAIAGAAPPPDVIVINTDDQPVSSFKGRFMPKTFRLLARKGTRFVDFVVSTPLCCPSRAVLATGQYGHNNGVLRNDYGQLRGRRHVLPRWLQRAGYRTIHVGRFMNGYENGVREHEVAPGWDVWRTLLAPRHYYGYDLTRNSGRRSFGFGRKDHLTGALSRIAARQIRRRVPRRQPFYLQLDYFAPHEGFGIPGDRCHAAAVPAPADERVGRGAVLPTSPGYDEADISDKPDFMQGLAELSGQAEGELRRRWRCLLGSVASVDRGIGKVFRALRRSGTTRETVLIFTSDNGYLFGQHRIALRKHYPYDEAVRVPFAIRLPRGVVERRQPARSAAPAANVDIVPTILELTGAEPCRREGCRTLDGRSLLGELGAGGERLPADRAILLASDQPRPRDGLVCSYRGLRTSRDVFVLHTRSRTSETGPCRPRLSGEHYDRRGDPFQLQSLVPAPADSPLAARQQQLAERLDRLWGCAGIAGRDPLPPGGHHCE